MNPYAVAGLHNARFDDLQESAIVHCTSTEDVRQAVAHARHEGLGCAIRCGGHDLAGRSSTRGLLIDVSPMRSVSMSNGLATVGSGARLGEVYGALVPNGVTIAAGTCPSVGVAGLTLGGGLGMLGRKYGTTSDQLAACRIVVADGRTLVCDEDHDPELFWALRGGGAGGFGVVTEFVFRTVPVPSVVTTFSLKWPLAHAAELIGWWLVWAGHQPDEIAASLDLRLSDQDSPPCVELYGSMLGSRSATLAALEQPTSPVKASPSSVSVTEGQYVDALAYWADRAGERLDEPRAAPLRQYEVVKSEFYAQPLPPQAVAGVIENFQSRWASGESRNIDFSPWGGAYNRVGPDATAFVHRRALYWIKHAATLQPDAPDSRKLAAHNWVNRSWELLRSHGTNLVFPNFPDPDLDDWGHAYYGPNYERLVKLKTRFDPSNVFRFRQSLPVDASAGQGRALRDRSSTPIQADRTCLPPRCESICSR